MQERGTECGERGEWAECYIPGNVRVIQGNEGARSAQDFMEFAVHGICSRRLM